jgi:hypothetical protein
MINNILEKYQGTLLMIPVSFFSFFFSALVAQNTHIILGVIFFICICIAPLILIFIDDFNS